MAHYAVEYGITRHPLAFLFCSFSLFFSDIKCGSTLGIFLLSTSGKRYNKDILQMQKRRDVKMTIEAKKNMQST